MFIALLMHLFTLLGGNQLHQEGAKLPFHEEESTRTSKDGALLGAEFGE